MTGNSGCAGPDRKRERMRWRLWCVAAAAAAMAAVAAATTADLPCPREYEVRYEFCVRDYRKNIEGGERVLGGLPLRDSRWVREYLEELPVGEGTTRMVRCTPNGKITLRVRGTDSGTVAARGAWLFAELCDTVERFGERLCREKEGELEKRIALLSNPEAGEREIIKGILVAQIAALADRSSGWRKYLHLLNEAELPEARLTASRGGVVALSAAVAAAVCVGVVLLTDLPLLARKKRKEGDDECGS